jgi:hypothetical protein
VLDALLAAYLSPYLTAFAEAHPWQRDALCREPAYAGRQLVPGPWGVGRRAADRLRQVFGTAGMPRVRDECPRTPRRCVGGYEWSGTPNGTSSGVGSRVINGWETILIALPTLIGGAFLGYVARFTEFRRDRRLEIYGDFVGSFIRVVDAGTSLAALHLVLGRAMYGQDSLVAHDAFLKAWPQSINDFEASLAKLLIIGSDEARKAGDKLSAFLADNVKALPPFTVGDDTEGWGSAAKIGPSEVVKQASERAREFAELVRPELTRWWPRVRRKGR